MSAENDRTVAESIEVLRDAARELREDETCGPLGDALAAWFDAEAKHAYEASVKHGAINILLILADNSDQHPLKITVGYNTTVEAVAVANRVLRGERL